MQTETNTPATSLHQAIISDDHGSILINESKIVGVVPIAAGMKDFNQLTGVFTTTKVSVKAQMLAPKSCSR